MSEQRLTVQNQKKNKAIKVCDLPEIPEKLYFSIGETSRLCALQPYVLRYWEQEFPQISPSKRRYNRRYYQKKDILLLRNIKYLLYEKGFTIEGAKAQLKTEIEQEQNASCNNLNQEGNSITKEVTINTNEIKVFFKETLLDLDSLLYQLEMES